MPDISLTKKQKYRSLLCICILIYLAALLVRMVKITLDPTLSRDGATYLVWVENWIATGAFYFDFFRRVGIVPPLSLWTIKTLAQTTGLDVEIAGRGISMFFGSVFPVIGFFFTLRLCRNIRIALFAALLLIFHPDLVHYSGQPLRENCYVFCTGILMIVLVEAVRESSTFKWALCGIFLALSTFCRYEGLEFVLIVPFVLGAMCYFGKIKVKDMVRNAAVFFLAFVLSVIPLLACADFEPRLFGRLKVFADMLF